MYRQATFKINHSYYYTIPYLLIFPSGEVRKQSAQNVVSSGWRLKVREEDSFGEDWSVELLEQLKKEYPDAEVKLGSTEVDWWLTDRDGNRLGNKKEC